MKNYCALLVLFFVGFKSYGQWENLNTGINDNLNGVVFFQSNGVVSGENGIYYTTTGGVGSTSWTELHDFTNTASAIFEDTKFTNCNATRSNTTATGIIYACGQTISDSKAVVFKINVPAMTYTLVYTGAANTKLNRIACQYNQSNYAAVGDNGKIISSNGTAVTEITPVTSDNLASVIFMNTTTNLIAFGVNDKLWKGTVTGNVLTSVVAGQNSLLNTKDLEYNISNVVNYSVGNENVNTFTIGSISAAVTSWTTNFNSPLNANTILSSFGNHFVGTANGIYKYVTTSNPSCLEWQPSSLNFAINRFWMQASGTYVYACGNNGLVMRTSNNGGATKPYVVLNVTGLCLGSPTYFTAYKGSGISAKWYIDGTLRSSSLTGFNYTFPATGQYIIRVEVTNSANETTIVSRTITIYTMPVIDKPVTVSDLILCKSESTQIQVENSEIGVKYVLRKATDLNSNYGESAMGNGGTLQFTTGLISESGDYFIDAVNTISNCQKRFTDNIAITVEKTKADFIANLINANVGETVNYYQNCQEAVNFNWQITSTSGTQVSSNPNPQYSYTTVGQVSATLDASSANGCHDVITKNGPNIVNAVTAPDCMLLVNRDADLPWPGYYRADIADTSPVTGGFLTCGSYNNPVFDSKYGVTYSIPNKKGAYLTKHDQNGILKWIVYTINEDFGDENNNYITSCVEDQDGNIYISGKSEGKFYDNAGHVINLYFLEVNTTAYFLIKLNSKGEFLWRLQNRYAGFNTLVVDNDNNLVAQIGCYCGFGYQNVPLYINGVFTENIGNRVTATDSNLGLVKFTPNGAVLWDTELKVTGTGSSSAAFKIKVDGANNIYFMMGSLYQTYLYSASNSNVTTLGNDESNLVKYNSSGNLVWVVRSKTTGTTGVASSSLTFDVDNAGNSYLMGRNDCTPTGGTAHVFYNADGSTTQTTKGSYMVAKINTNGVCEWIQSTTERALGGSIGGLLDNNELFVLGNFTSGSSDPISTGEFDSADGTSYALTMNRYNEFMTVYDLNGVLRRVVSSYQGNDNPFVPKYFYSLFKTGNYFYLSRNINNTVAGYKYYGSVYPAFTADNYDGTTVRFKESCGTIVYRNLLATDQFAQQQIKLYPNPTNGNFTIDLLSQYDEATIELHDIYGKLLKKESYTDTDKIVSSLEGATGIYLLKVTTAQGAQSFKLIKE